jgi:hypothetical protein
MFEYPQRRKQSRFHALVGVWMWSVSESAICRVNFAKASKFKENFDIKANDHSNMSKSRRPKTLAEQIAGLDDPAPKGILL